MDERWWYELQPDDVARHEAPCSRGGAALFVASPAGESEGGGAPPPVPVVLFGGTFYGNLKNDVWAFDLGAAEWREVARNSPTSGGAGGARVRWALSVGLLLLASTLTLGGAGDPLL